MASNGKIKRQAKSLYYKREWLKYYALLKKYKWLGYYFQKPKSKDIDDTLEFDCFKRCLPTLVVNPAPIVTISCT